jgi:hypothetical protein
MLPSMEANQPLQNLLKQLLESTFLISEKAYQPCQKTGFPFMLHNQNLQPAACQQ